ncbi:hypothetical protein F5Y13DRAFT_185763 [Hypoxylon sp. FL1857]|nr:hypothetical protein F5Y13DRAFT_185763 [Hypoxylon sp. FL1857]
MIQESKQVPHAVPPFPFRTGIAEIALEPNHELPSSRLAGNELNSKALPFRDEDGNRVRGQQDQIEFLLATLDQLRRENESLRTDLRVQRINNNVVTDCMARANYEKQCVSNERDKERFEKDLNSLILEQYRDEIIEKQRIICIKDEEIGHLAGKLRELLIEVHTRGNQRRRAIEPEQSNAKFGRDSMKQMRPQEAARKRPKKRNYGGKAKRNRPPIG